MLFVHLTGNQLFQITVPSRTQTFLAMGKPITMGVSGNVADLIVKSDSGIISESDNSIILAASITVLSQLPYSQRDNGY